MFIFMKTFSRILSIVKRTCSRMIFKKFDFLKKYQNLIKIYVVLNAVGKTLETLSNLNTPKAYPYYDSGNPHLHSSVTGYAHM